MRPSTGIQETLQQARQELLDLSMRNRLLNTPRTSNRSTRLEIADEMAREVFRILVHENASMTFLARQDPGDDSAEEPVPDSTSAPAISLPGQRNVMPLTRSGPALFDVTDSLQPVLHPLPQPEDDDPATPERHTDRKLQTDRSSEQLQTRLLWLFREARTAMEEQGANLLYLAVGFLKWYESPSSQVERFSPLLLIPVELERTSAKARFRLSYTGEDITTNLSLQSKLRHEFRFELPDVPPIEELDVESYFADVRSAVSGQPRWDVLDNDMVLWLYSFSNFLMFRDLDTESWPENSSPATHRLIGGLLGGHGFTSEPPLDVEEHSLDELVPASDLVHVLDADSSQTAAIEMVRSGRDLVVQGPPGTGKSQTIANMIAAAVKDGRRVLFISEKLAALEVVKRRLDTVGLGDICLELHSRKARKKQVLEELQRTHALGPPQQAGIKTVCDTLDNTKRELNRFVSLMHTPDDVSELSPFQVQAKLVVLQADGFTGRPFELSQATGWSPDQFQQRIEHLADLASHMDTLGTPADHPWRGVNLETFLPSDRDALGQSIGRLLENLPGFIEASRALGEAVGVSSPPTLGTAGHLVRIGRHIVVAPSLDTATIDNPVWTDDWPEVKSLVQSGRSLNDCRAALDGVLVEQAWQTDVTAIRRDLDIFGPRWWKWFNGSWRSARSRFRQLLTDRPPTSLEDQLQILDRLIEGRRAAADIDHPRNSQTLGPAAFGTNWFGDRSDWTAMEALTQWVEEGRGRRIDATSRRILATTADLTGLPRLIEETVAAGQLLRKSLDDLVGLLDWDLAIAFDIDDTQELSLADLQSRLASALDDQESLFDWIAFQQRWRQLNGLDLSALGDRIATDQLSADEVIDTFRYVYFDTLFRDICGRFPELPSFRGESHEQTRETFQKIDIRRIELARQEVATAHHRNLPAAGAPGELRTLEREWRKKRRHMPLRRLLAETGRVIQQIKPVFMMSPQSVAQFLDPGIIEFDLLLVDEASQVRPVEALGAVSRCHQMVVVGDHRQLPPTAFFRTAAGGDQLEDDRDDEHDIQDLESILDVCATQGITQSMLEWHYRSRHESLITVSNVEFYDSRLKIIPGPLTESDRIGLRFHLVEDGVFDRGGTTTNRAEAIRVADAVMDFARSSSDHTLGVGAFSVRQRDAILDELELRRRDDPSCEEFFLTSNTEPFFVKNLENIQGDERDVILISIGYGPDREGRFTRNFGPLNRDGGERRLNVLITRARQRCEVFSSFTSAQLDLGDSPPRGPRALKTFLQFAETGVLDVAAGSDRGFDSPFEEEVFRALTAMGHDVRSQIGTSGFFVDLAVVHPQRPGSFAIGIECDGASYHSSACARDRDRLRQSVLEDRGWVIHRIWSTDWFYRPEDELRRADEAIQRAVSGGQSGPSGTTPAVGDSQVERHQPESSHHRDELSVPYQEAAFQIPSTPDIHLLPLAKVCRFVARIVKTEGPIHADEIARRLTTLAGKGRTGRRITETVTAAVAKLTSEGALVHEGEFYESPGHPLAIRDRSAVVSPHLRKPASLPPREIRFAALAVVENHTGVSHDEMVTEVARLLGFQTTSAQLRQHIEPGVSALVADGTLSERNNRLYTGHTA